MEVAMNHNMAPRTGGYDPFAIQPNAYPSSAYGAANADPFGIQQHSFSADPFVARGTANVDPFGFSPQANAAPFAITGNSVAAYDPFAQGIPERMAGPEVPGRMRAALGRVADKLAGLFTKENFAAGGRVDQGLAAAHGHIKTADKVANGRVAGVLKKIPGVGKYVKGAQEIVGAVSSVAEVAGLSSYGNMVTAAQQMYEDPSRLAHGAAEYAGGAVGRIVGAGAGEALRSFGEAAGVSMETDENGNRLRIRKAKLAKFAIKAVTSRGGSVLGVARDAAMAGAGTIKQQARAELGGAQGAAYGAFDRAKDTGSVYQFPSAPAQAYDPFGRMAA